MDRAVLLTGDRDFEPLVHSLVQLGVRVEVAGDKKTTSRYLRHAADGHQRLSFDDYHMWTVGLLRERFPNSIWRTGARPHEAYAVERAVLGDKEFVLMKSDRTMQYYIYGYQFYGDTNHLCLELNDLNRLKLYFELQYGEVVWENLPERR